MLDGMPASGVGPEAREAFIRRMDLGRFREAGCELSSIERAGSSVRLAFDWAGVGAAVVSVSSDDGTGSFISTGLLAFRLVGSEVTRPWAVLMGRLATEAAGMTIEELERLIWTGGDQPDPSSMTAVSRFDPILTWGPDDGWRRFVCDAAMERRFREAFEFDSDSSFIVHGDLECRFVSPGARVRLPGFFVYPFELFSHYEAVGPVTDLDDHDVIVDSTQKIEQKVRREMLDGSFRGPVVVIATCVPVIVAEDPGNVLERLSPICPEGIRYVTPVSPYGPTEIFMQSFSDLRRDVLSRPPRKASVGLVGYRPGRAGRELEALLAGHGISVTGSIVPMVTRRLLASTLSASTILLAPSRYHEETFSSLVEGASEAGRTVGRPAFPWGVDRTAAWLREVASLCGVDVSKDAIDDQVAKAVNIISQIHCEKVFGFVCDPSEVDRFVDPVGPAGLAPLSFICGLGLRVRLVVHGDGDAAAAAGRRVVDTIDGASGLVDAVGFEDESGLDLALSAPDLAAVYSEMFFDYRVTGHGLPTFSPRVFEPGFDGAIRTLRRLVRLAGLPFFRRYIGVTGDRTVGRSV